jgi:hypothetical protein
MSNIIIPWVNPKITIGNTATGQYYYDRPHIVTNIWEEIDKGNHVLLAAPRRVGKSSVMKHMVTNSKPEYKCIFENIQGVDSQKIFFKTIYQLIKTCLNKGQRAAAWLQELYKEIKIEEVGFEGLKFGDRSIDYLEGINLILPKLNSKDVKIILFIDELPEVLHSLYKRNKSEEAISILKNVRRWRQEDQFKNLRLVLAGSIGIHHIVKTLEGRTVDINDFNMVDFDALTNLEADNYVSWATNGATLQYNFDLRQHLLSKIQYYLPYFINLMLDEINRDARKVNKTEISRGDIDRAFDKVVKSHDHFKEWKNRLFEYMETADAEFLNQVLVHIAHRGMVNKKKLHDIAVKHSKLIDYMELIDGLERDGYIVEQRGQFVFLSPFLQAFWRRNYPVYEA